MFNSSTLKRLTEVHPELARRVKLLDQLVPSLSIQVTQGLRSWADQDALYAQGRTAPGPACVHDGAERPVGTCHIHPFGVSVTNAMAGYSAHNFGYATDLVPEDVIPGQPDWDLTHPAWQKMLASGKICGLAEGATWRTFPDNPHFYLEELPADPTDEMRQDFKDAGTNGVWSTFPKLTLWNVSAT